MASASGNSTSSEPSQVTKPIPAVSAGWRQSLSQTRSAPSINSNAFTFLLFLAQRQADRDADEGRHDSQREADGNLVEVDQHHLQADEDEHRRQTVLEQREAAGHVGEQKIHGTQA